MNVGRCRSPLPSCGNAEILAEVVMILRIYALYRRSMRILILLGTLWIAQVTVSSIGMTTGYGEHALFSSDVIDYLFIWDVLALKLPPGFVGTQLILNGSSKPG